MVARQVVWVVFAAVIGASWQPGAEAQTPRSGRGSVGGYSRPTTSPYLDLLYGDGRGGRGFNYFRRLRPEQEQRQTNQEFRESLQTVRRQQEDLRAEFNLERRKSQTGWSTLGTTGHPTTFLDERGFYSAGRRGR